MPYKHHNKENTLFLYFKSYFLLAFLCVFVYVCMLRCLVREYCEIMELFYNIVNFMFIVSERQSVFITPKRERESFDGE